MHPHEALKTADDWRRALRENPNNAAFCAVRCAQEHMQNWLLAHPKLEAADALAVLEEGIMVLANIRGYWKAKP